MSRSQEYEVYSYHGQAVHSMLPIASFRLATAYPLRLNDMARCLLDVGLAVVMSRSHEVVSFVEMRSVSENLSGADCPF